MKPPINILREVFEYRDGRLFYRHRPYRHFPNAHQCNVWNAKYAGKEAGVIQPSRNGHRCKITLRPFILRRYQVVWALHHGEWLPLIDHRDGNSLNDSIENLRPATYSQNGANARAHRDNPSGAKGVHFRKDRGLWLATIRANGETVYLGSYFTKDEAVAVYERHAKRLNGEFACPHHSDHRLSCTGSNLPGQRGSIYQ